MKDNPGFLVVGVDGSRHSDAALRFAIDEAVRCGDGLHLVSAWTMKLPLLLTPGIPSGLPQTEAALQALAEGVQQQAFERVFERMSGLNTPVTVWGRTPQGYAGRVLVEASQDARVLIVGSRLLGTMRAALLGSVSRYCVHNAACPVVVVPGIPEQGRKPLEAMDPAPAEADTSSWTRRKGAADMASSGWAATL